MKDTFSSFHPIVVFIYFFVVIGIGMFVIHPIFLGISLVGSLSYAIYLGGLKIVRMQVLYSLPFCIGIGLINPIFNHEGITIIGYMGDNPLTLESIYYGIMMSILFVNMILWFYVYNYVMTSDKLIYLIGRWFPSLSLVFSMTLRFVPLFQRQFKKVMRAQEGLGNSIQEKKFWEKLKWGIKILSIMLTWILENAIDTADSMKSRGYGLKGRTSFCNYYFTQKDIGLLVVILLLIGGVSMGIMSGVTYVRYFPSFKVNPITATHSIIYLAYGGLCILPLSLHIVEDIRWHYLRWKA